MMNDVRDDKKGREKLIPPCPYSAQMQTLAQNACVVTLHVINLEVNK